MLAPSSLLPSTDLRPHDGASSDQLARAFLQQLAQDERKRLKAGQRSDPFGFGDDPLLNENDAVEQIVVQGEENRPEATHVPVPAAGGVLVVLRFADWIDRFTDPMAEATALSRSGSHSFRSA